MTDATGTPIADRFHPSEFIREEMNARGWDVTDVAARMGGDPVSLLELQMYLAVGETGDERLRLGGFAEKLEQAFGISAQFWRNLEQAWLGKGGGREQRA